MSKYLNRVITNPLYNRVREEAEKILKGIPKLGPAAYKTVKKFEEGLENLLVPGILFEELGFRYFGPIDGHDVEQLIKVFRNVLLLNRPVFVHVITFLFCFFLQGERGGEIPLPFFCSPY